MEKLVQEKNAVDPRIRLICACLLSCEAALLTSLLALLPLVVCACTLVAFARPPSLLKRLGCVNFFIAFLWLFTPWSTPGESLFTLFGFSITYEGVFLCILVSVKANCIVCLCTALLASLDSLTLGHAMRHLHVSEKLIFLLLFAERSFYILRLEWKHLHESALLRCFYARCSWYTYTTLASMLGLLLLRCFDYAKKSYEALLLRSFSGKFLSVREFRYTKKDFFFAFALFLPFVLSLLFQFSVFFM